MFSDIKSLLFTGNRSRVNDVRVCPQRVSRLTINSSVAEQNQQILTQCKNYALQNYSVPECWETFDVNFKVFLLSNLTTSDPPAAHIKNLTQIYLDASYPAQKDNLNFLKFNESSRYEKIYLHVVTTNDLCSGGNNCTQNLNEIKNKLIDEYKSLNEPIFSSKQTSTFSNFNYYRLIFMVSKVCAIFTIWLACTRTEYVAILTMDNRVNDNRTTIHQVD